MSNKPTIPAEIAVETLLAVKELNEVTMKDIGRISDALDITATELFAELDKSASEPGFFSLR